MNDPLQFGECEDCAAPEVNLCGSCYCCSDCCICDDEDDDEEN